MIHVPRFRMGSPMLFRSAAWILPVVLTFGLAACAKKAPPVAKPTSPPPAPAGGSNRPPAPPTPVTEPQPVPVEPGGDAISGKDLDEINKNSPFQPLFFGYDQADVSPDGQQVLNANAAIMKKYSSWIITIEGHADERGTREYNIALGARRGSAVQDFMIARGIAANRMRTVSYGKERPVAVCDDISCWSQNRRAVTVLNASS